MVGSSPMTSNVASAPRPSVSSRTADAGSVSGSVDGLRSAELRGHRQLRVEFIDCDDRPCVSDLGPLDDVQSDPAAAEDGHRVAFANARRVRSSPDAGKHRAADQRGDLHRHVGRYPDRADLGDDGLLGERAQHGHLAQRHAVGFESWGAVEQATGRRHRSQLAQVALAAAAEVAPAALRVELRDDVVADLEPRHAFTDLDHLSGALVPRHDRRRREGTVPF